MKSRFWQNGITYKDRHKIGFIVLHGHYEWNTMSFGLTNTPLEFQLPIDEVMLLFRNIIVYIDDVII